MEEQLGRNLSLDIVRATEAAALFAAPWMGRGNKNAADQGAVNGMRVALSTIPMNGVVVIGEGEKDEAPMLYIGERVGTAEPPGVDIAVDPIDGTRLLAEGMPNSVSVLAMTEAGTMYYPPGIMYMNKIAVGHEAADAIDITQPITFNLQRIADAKRMDVRELIVVILDRPRHKELIAEVRAAGARTKIIPDGDVAGALMTALPGTGIDVLMGIGGSPEAVVAAAALKCVGGAMQATLWPRDDHERRIAREAGLDLDVVLSTDDLVKSNDVFFSVTGITDGEFVQGVHFTPGGATTESIVMRSRTGTIRRISATHSLKKLREIGAVQFD
jgi:fructose-1,6-bisphosphatase II